MEINKNMPKLCYKFYCENCDYITSKKANYYKHIITSKHQRMTHDDTGGQKVAKSSKK